MNTPKRPKALFTLAQLCCIAAALVVLFFFFTPAYVLFTYIEQADMLQHDNTLSVVICSGALCLRDALAGVCLIYAALEAIAICQRLKKASAFCEKNEKTLGNIAKAMGLAGAITLLFGDSVVSFLLSGLPAIAPAVERFLLPFMLLTLAAMVRTVQVLMRRALSMQTENDLTV